MKKLDEWLIGAKCALHRLFFGKQPGIDGIIVASGHIMISLWSMKRSSNDEGRKGCAERKSKYVPQILKNFRFVA